MIIKRSGENCTFFKVSGDSFEKNVLLMKMRAHSKAKTKQKSSTLSDSDESMSRKSKNVKWKQKSKEFPLYETLAIQKEEMRWKSEVKILKS